MKKPDGTIDIIGLGLQSFLAVKDLVTEFAPDKETRKANKKKRRIKRAIQILRKPKWKGFDVANYVNLNFGEFAEEERAEITGTIKGFLEK